jgi:hypothetical protein
MNAEPSEIRWIDCPCCAADMPDTQLLCDACIEDTSDVEGWETRVDSDGDV